MCGYFILLRYKQKEAMDRKDILQLIKGKLREHLPQGGRAVLYGSQARGDAGADSDWDVLVLLDKARLEVADYDNITYPLTVLGWDIGAVINPVMYTLKEWTSNSITPFYKNVEHDGIVLV